MENTSVMPLDSLTAYYLSQLDNLNLLSLKEMTKDIGDNALDDSVVNAIASKYGFYIESIENKSSYEIYLETLHVYISYFRDDRILQKIQDLSSQQFYYLMQWISNEIKSFTTEGNYDKVGLNTLEILLDGYVINDENILSSQEQNTLIADYEDIINIFLDDIWYKYENNKLQRYISYFIPDEGVGDNSQNYQDRLRFLYPNIREDRINVVSFHDAIKDL